MSKDSSSSSSEEDDQDSPAAQTQQQAKVKRPAKYQCPADYVTFSHKPCDSLLTDNFKKGNKELWLIKAPAGFNPECFKGVQVPLSGLQTLRVPAADGGASGRSQQIYSVLASSEGTPQLRLLTGHRRSSPDDVMVCGPAFSGLLNVCESYGDVGANRDPKPIPAAPAPALPPGLKQRFKPFGSKTPTLTRVVESEVDGADSSGPSSATLLPRVVKRFTEEPGEEEEEDEGERRKRKKKKKDKKIKEEEEEDALEVKEEPVAQIMEFELFQDAGVSVEKRKKKKKKKDRERGEAEAEAPPPPPEEVQVKSEPMDASYGDVEASGKKKKKKKSRTKEEN